MRALTLTYSSEVFSLYEDIFLFTQQVNKALPSALESIGSDMWELLKEHIQHDVYDEYYPQVYQRRFESGLLWDLAWTAEAKGNSLETEYMPTGEHETQKWHTRDFDNLIEWLQHSHNIKSQNVPARPFWNNFLDDLGHGRLIEMLISALPKYEIISDGNDVTGLDEYYLSAEGTGSTPLDFIDL